MKTNISNRDWELLSEYLDQQLSQGKQSKLEMRMQQEPELRAAFEDLRKTRSILRSAPRLRAPRNFTLKPHMVPERKPRRVYPFFQFASAVATVMLLLVFVGEIFNPGFGTPVGMEAPPPAAPAAAPDLMMELEAPVEAAVEAEAVEGEPGVVEKGPQVEIEQAPSIASVPEDDIPPSDEPGEGMRLLAEPEFLDPGAALAIPEPDDTSEAVIAQEKTFMGLNLWRLLQISLAVIAVGSGFAALYFRRIA
jgi:hypothetical protein